MGRRSGDDSGGEEEETLMLDVEVMSEWVMSY